MMKRNACRGARLAVRRDATRTRLLPLVTSITTTLAMDGAWAQGESAPEPVELETITVFAEKLGRSIMDTSTSVIVLDSEALQNRPAIDGLNDLLGRLPNVTMSGTGNEGPAVRGVDGTGPASGANAFLAGTRARFSLQVDGRSASYNEVVFGDAGIWDVAQIEVLRGPQSALQGRNAIAGTLAMKTKDPTFEREAAFRVLGGNMQDRQYSAALSGPLVDDQLAVRLSADHKTSESYVRTSPFVSRFGSVDEPREVEANTFRGKLLYRPKALEDFSALLTFTHSDYSGPQQEIVRAPFDDHVTRFDPMPLFEPRTNSGIIDLNWRASAALSFQTLVALTDLNVKRVAPIGEGNVNIDARELIAEPLMRFDVLDGRLRGIGGLYYFRSTQDEFIDLFEGGTFEDRTTTKAVFGEGTFKVSSKFDVTLGARYEEENRWRQGSLFIFDIDLDETYSVFLPKLVLTWHLTPDLTVGTMAARGYNGGSAGFTFEPPFAAYTFDPEYVWNYEAFARSSLANDRLLITGNLFYSDYKDMQLPFVLGPFSSVIRNADNAISYGAELSAAWQATDGLHLTAGVGLLQTEIRKYPSSGWEGNELPRSPSFSADLGATWEHASGFQLSIDSHYSGAYYSRNDNDPRTRTDPYWTLNAQAAYKFERGRVFTYLNNAFDAGDAVFVFPQDDFGPEHAQILRPRTYGLGVELQF